MSPFLTTPDWLYLTLRAELYRRSGEAQAYLVTLPELMRLWRCSDKTAKRQLRRLVTEHHVHYVPGRGRGHRSCLRFPVSLYGEISALVCSLTQEQNVSALARLARLPIPAAWVMTSEVGALFGLTRPAPGVHRLRSVVMRDLSSLNPLHASNTLEAHLLFQTLDPLLRVSGRQLKPHLAHHWEEASGGLRWTFFLRRAVQFHHGRTLDSADVAHTMSRLQASAGWLLPHLTGVETPDPLTVTVHLNRPDCFLPWRLTGTQALITPRDVPYDEAAPTGTGAFRLTVAEGNIRLRAFDAHFGGPPLIDEVEFYRVPRGEDSPGYFVEGADSRASDAWQAEVGVQFLIWNAWRLASQNAMLRAAVNELYDVQALWQDTKRQEPLRPASSFYPRRTEERPVRAHCLARAAELIRQADHDGPPLKLYALSWAQPQEEARWLAARAECLGLRMEVCSFELDDSLLIQDADLVMLGEVAGANEHLAFLTAMQQPELLFRQLLPADVLARIDAALDGFRMAYTFEERDVILDQVEELLLSRYWMTLTYHRVKRRRLHPLIRDVWPDAYGRIDLKRLWVGSVGALGS